ncbi:MAG: hypothetical protein R3F59_24170 [Myxococcota bacterium]
MRRYWGHVAMLLLGVSLTAGFYEGRALVQNTARALSAATTITAAPPAPRRERRQVQREARPTLAVEEEDLGTAPLDHPKRRARRFPPGPPEQRPLAGLGLSPRAVRQRGPRHALPTPQPEPDEVLDTGLEAPLAPEQ